MFLEKELMVLYILLLIIIPIKNIKFKNSVPNNLNPTQPLSLRYYVPWFDGASIGDDLDHMALLNLMKCS